MDPPAWTKPWTQGQSRTQGPSPAKKTYTDQAGAARDHPAPPHFNVEVRTAGVHFRLRKNAHLLWRAQGFAGNIETRGYGGDVGLWLRVLVSVRFFRRRREINAFASIIATQTNVFCMCWQVGSWQPRWRACIA